MNYAESLLYISHMSCYYRQLSQNNKVRHVQGGDVKTLNYSNDK